MRRTKTLTGLFLTGLAIVSLVGCGGEGSSSNIETVKDLKVDFTTGEYSFTGVSSAKNYFIRVFQHFDKGEEIPSGGDMPVATKRIRNRSDQTTYTGFLSFSKLVPGDDYDAYIYTYIKDKDGNLENARYETPSYGVYKKAYDTPDITSSGFTATKEETTIEVTMTGSESVGGGGMNPFGGGDDSSNFLSDELLSHDPDYLINLYQGETKIDSKTIKHSDLTTEEKEVTQSSPFGGESKVTKKFTTGKVDFTISDASLDYYVTLTILSTDDSAYFDSAESAKKEVTAPSTTPTDPTTPNPPQA